MEAWKGSAWRTIRSGEAFVNGAWRVLKWGEAYVDGAWRSIVTFVQHLSLAISSGDVFWSGTGSSVSSGTPYVATPTGGLAPFTYAWVKTSGDAISIISPATASTRFIADSLTVGETRTATFQCTVTDSLGTTASASASIAIARTDSI